MRIWQTPACVPDARGRKAHNFDSHALLLPWRTLTSLEINRRSGNILWSANAQGAHGVVVSHPLRMRKALGSNPSVSILANDLSAAPRGHRSCGTQRKAELQAATPRRESAAQRLSGAGQVREVLPEVWVRVGSVASPAAAKCLNGN